MSKFLNILQTLSNKPVQAEEFIRVRMKSQGLRTDKTFQTIQELDW